MTAGAVHHQMITPFGFSLKERAPMLHKVLLTRIGFYIGVKVGRLPFQTGIFALKVFNLLFETLDMFGKTGEVRLNLSGIDAVGNESVDMLDEFKQGRHL